MAVRPCADSVRCPGSDDPRENYSSEAPDDLRFIGLSFDPYGGHWHDPNGNYKAEGCLGVCYSTISQEDADFCAALQAYLCNQDDCDPADPNCEYHCPGDPRCSCTENDPDPNCHIHCPGDPRCNPDCPPDDPNCAYDCPGDPRCAVTPVYYNVEQHCNLICPDGNTFTWVVPARKFAADSQLLADRMANSYCKQQANFHLLCLSNIPDTAIENTPYKNPNGSTVRIQATGATVVTGKDVWTLVSGVIPPGLTLHLNQEVSGGIALDGVPTVFGAYSFTVKVTTPSGDFMVKTYTITVSGLYNDMGMDQAVYHPTRGTVFGVRGGYLFEFQAGSDTLLANRKRYTVPGISDASIAYDAGTDRLFVGYWNDPANGDISGPVATNQRMFKINPATLVVEDSINFDVLQPGDGYTQQFSGPHRLTSQSNRIYGFVNNGSGGSHATRPFWYDAATTAFVIQGSYLDSNPAGWSAMQINGAEVWIVQPDEKRVWFCDPNNFTQNSSVIVPNYIFDMCINPANGRGYFTTKTNEIVRVSQAHAALASLTMPNSNAYILCIRYNSYDGKIYAPDAQNNVIYVIDPATDTVVATKTGFDSPIDLVFTPTKVFCVQEGVVGFKEVV